jgi:hypothetical protein
MMTNTSGCAAMTAAAVSRMRRKITGSRWATAKNPMMAKSSIGNRLASPSAAISPPPMPEKFT